MANPMFGWSAQDVFALVQTCDRFITAYRHGPGGASANLVHFKGQVQKCKSILEFIRTELEQQDREFFYSKFQRDSLKDTLEQCEKVFKSEFLKPTEEQKLLSKVAATAKWLWCDEEQVKKLSGILEGHINYIQVFLQLLSSKHAQTQISHLESHGESLEVHTKYLQRQDQRLQKHSEDLQKQGQQIKEIRDILLSAKYEPRWNTPHPRAQSVMSMPVASSSYAVVAPEMYVQGQKSLADVQDLLEQVNSEIDDLQRDENEKNVLRNIQAELEDVEERILKSIERNGAKGVQNALAENDSAYASSISSIDAQRNSHSSYSSGSSNWNAIAGRRSSQVSIPKGPLQSLGGSNWNAAGSPQSPTTRNTYCENGSSNTTVAYRDAHSPLTRWPSDGSNWSDNVFQQASQTSEYKFVKSCQAEILFNDGKHKPVPLACVICKKFQGEMPCEIFPEYIGKLSGRLEGPALVFDENKPRPIPHIVPRGPRAHPYQYAVQIKGVMKIHPAMKSLEYVFKNAEDSRLFQESVFNKTLILKHPINVQKIRSGRDKESDNVVLRLWKTPNIMLTRMDYSILYYVNDEGRPVKEYMEIFLHGIESLLHEKGKWLRVQFKAESVPGKKLKWLEFRLHRNVTEENEADRTTLAKYLNPNWLPTAG
ncbi:hypothetical protein EG329_004128 [Mollisiaceae sp. DMI_Dod_QoI]|nr:hypothetical protein EG329_004128 [Helotiales sp. DMI_Dod_QoI]